jgi:tRNA (mo5U34)-methyltransferase
MTVDLQERVAALPWHHSIDLGGGVVTRGNKSAALCNDEAALIFDRVDLRGRSVLDIGAWNGFFSFEAKRRGANRVLATDSYCWAHRDIRGREAFDVARAALRLDVDALEVDVADLSVKELGEFDVVLYLGVFYHRIDAIEALAGVAALAKQVLILETHLDLREINVPAMAFYPGRELNNDPTNWWGPNEQCVDALLRGHGFTEIEISRHPSGPTRAIFHAWRSTESRLGLLANKVQLQPLAEFKRLEYTRMHPILSKVSSALGYVRSIFRSKRLR